MSNEIVGKLIPISFKANEMEEKGYNQNKMIIPCVQINKQFSDLTIITNRNELEIIYNEISKRTKDNLKEIFQHSYNTLIKMKQTELMNPNLSQPEWNFFADNVILFYLCRFILLNKEIPIIVGFDEDA